MDRISTQNYITYVTDGKTGSIKYLWGKNIIIGAKKMLEGGVDINYAIMMFKIS